MAPVAETVISLGHSVLRLLVLLAHALVLDIVGLVAQGLAHTRIIAQHLVLVRVDSLQSLPFTLVVQTTLVFFVL